MAFQQTFVVKAGTNLQTSVQWMVRTVQIDNQTQVWYKLNPWNLLVPPNTQGIIYNYPLPSQTVDIAQVSYQGQPNFVFTGDNLFITAFDEVLGASPGQNILSQDARSIIGNAVVGNNVSLNAPFPIYGILVNNNTGSWYEDGIGYNFQIPPWQNGFTFDVFPPVTTTQIFWTTAPQGQYDWNNQNPAGIGITATAFAHPIGLSQGYNVGPIPYIGPNQNRGTQSNLGSSGITLNWGLNGPDFNDLLVVAVATANSNAVTATISPPGGGWITAFAAATTTTSYWIGYKPSSGTSSYTWSWPAFASGCSCIAMQGFRGWTQNYISTSFPTLQSTSVGSANTFNITPQVAGPGLIIPVIIGANNGGSAYQNASPTNWAITSGSSTSSGASNVFVAIGASAFSGAASYTETVTFGSGGPALLFAGLIAF